MLKGGERKYRWMTFSKQACNSINNGFESSDWPFFCRVEKGLPPDTIAFSLDNSLTWYSHGPHQNARNYWTGHVTGTTGGIQVNKRCSWLYRTALARRSFQVTGTEWRSGSTGIFFLTRGSSKSNLGWDGRIVVGILGVRSTIFSLRLNKSWICDHLPAFTSS